MGATAGKSGAVYFDSPAAFRRWLEAHHASADELLVGVHKAHTGRPTLTWPESVDDALCVGWIDGIRRRVDDDRSGVYAFERPVPAALIACSHPGRLWQSSPRDDTDSWP